MHAAVWLRYRYIIWPRVINSCNYASNEASGETTHKSWLVISSFRLAFFVFSPRQNAKRKDEKTKKKPREMTK